MMKELKDKINIFFKAKKHKKRCETKRKMAEISYIKVIDINSIERKKKF